MSKGRQLLANAFWVYGSQIATVVVQMAYAAVTSRLVDAEGFAVYAVALSVGALTLLLANGGLGQAVARMDFLDDSRVRGLTGYALVLGVGGSALLYWTAPFWAVLWGIDDAVGPLRVMSLAVLFSPLLGLASGLLRRQGKYRVLSIAIFSCNCAGMIVGGISVFAWRSASALLIANILGQLLTLCVCAALNLRLLFGRFAMRTAADDLKFSWKLTAASLVAYFNGNIGKLAVSNFMPAGALGHWNRADVVTTVPFMQIQNAIIQSVYPEFRHDLKNGKRAKIVWVDLLALVAWVALPASAVGAVVIPPVASLLFGEGWADAIALAAPLAIVAGIQIVSTVLASAVEALGRFRWIWLTQGILLVIYTVAAAATLLTREWYPIIIGLLMAQIAQHVLHICLCAAEGYLDVAVLAGRYLGITGVSLVLAALTWGMRFALETSSWIWLAGFTVGFACLGFAIWQRRAKLEPVRIVKRYRGR